MRVFHEARREGGDDERRQRNAHHHQAEHRYREGTEHGIDQAL